MSFKMTKWDERYSEPGYTFGTTPNAFLVSMVDRLPHGKILMLAEGEGRNAVYLASRGYDVTAVDSSSVGLDKAAQLASERGVKFTTILADLGEFRIDPEKWDGIVSCYCHLPLQIRTEMHRAVVNGLKPGGVFVLEGFSKEQMDYDTGGPKVPEMLLDVEQLKGELDGLEFIHAARLIRDVKEGRGHTGLASVVQLFCMKPLAPDKP